MSASLLSGNAALGLSASPARAQGAKVPAAGAADETAFQLAVGSVGEQGRRTAERQPGPGASDTAPKAEKTPEPQPPRLAAFGDPAPRLHKWILGMDANPAAGDLLLTGGALVPEDQASEAPVDASVDSSDETRVPEPQPRGDKDTLPPVADEAPPMLRSQETDWSRPAPAETQTSSDSKLPDGEVVPDKPEAADEAKQPPEPESSPLHANSRPESQASDAGYVPRGAAEVAEPDAEPPRSELWSSTPDQPVRTDRVVVDTVSRLAPVQAPHSAQPDKTNAAPEPQNPRPEAMGHSLQPLAAVAGQGTKVAATPAAATAARPVVGSKAAIAQNVDPGVEHAAPDAPERAVDDFGKQDRPRLDDTGRNPPTRDPVGDQRSQPRSAPLDVRGQSAGARDPSGVQAVQLTSQTPQTPQTAMVTVVEARQYPGVAPQQANTEAIVRAVSGNEIWSAALRGETAVQSSAPLQTLKIRLNPAELGMVDATLRLAGDRLMVELSVDTPEAYRQLSESRQTVLNALRGQGYGVEQISVQLAASDRSSQQGTSTGQQQGSFDGQPTQDNSRQSGEGGRFGQENGHGDDRGSGNAARGNTPAGEPPDLPHGVPSDGAVYL